MKKLGFFVASICSLTYADPNNYVGQPNMEMQVNSPQGSFLCRFERISMTSEDSTVANTEVNFISRTQSDGDKQVFENKMSIDLRERFTQLIEKSYRLSNPVADESVCSENFKDISTAKIWLTEGFGGKFYLGSHVVSRSFLSGQLKGPEYLLRNFAPRMLLEKKEENKCTMDQVYTENEKKTLLDLKNLCLGNES